MLSNGIGGLFSGSTIYGWLNSSTYLSINFLTAYSLEGGLDLSLNLEIKS